MGAVRRRKEACPDAGMAPTPAPALGVAGKKVNLASLATLAEVDSLLSDNTRVFEVPQGHYFMMGDDRDNSADSRVPAVVGYVPYDNLVGPAQFVVASFDQTTSIFRPWTLFTGFRGERFLKAVE